MRENLLMLLLLAALVVPPFFLASLSREPRGVRRGGPARHPFRLPGPVDSSGAEDRSGLVEFDLPPWEPADESDDEDPRADA